MNARPGIHRLARNTVMLTALAVVHWNEKRLPEQRAELYESILRWLARSREDRKGRAKPERCLELLRRLALEMFKAEGGRKVQASRHWAAEQIQSEFGNVKIAQQFLEEEELDSGILVRRGEELRFWHLSFQEYLAARAIAGLKDEEQLELLLEDPPRRFYQPEWREVVLLLAGVLYAQGREKVDKLFDAVLDHLGDKASLIDQARATGLLLGIVRDLAPFDYQPKNQTKFQSLITATLGIFDREHAATVPINLRIEAAEALGQAGDPRLADTSKVWVEIPGGSFWMGAQQDDPQARNYDADAGDYETPHEVELDGFRIGRWPVTVQEYADFIEDEAYSNERWWAMGGFQQWQNPEDWEQQTEHRNRPVVGISWFEAMAFCAWRTEHLSIMGKLPLGRQIRLPTEAEWEWAARHDRAWRYPWGNEDCSEDRLNYNHNIGVPTPVGLYPQGATPEGVLDLAGNVWEWCHDWFSGTYYQTCASQGKVKNPMGPKQWNYRVLRGGSWILNPPFARCAYRVNLVPGFRFSRFGFRLVCASPITGL